MVTAVFSVSVLMGCTPATQPTTTTSAPAGPTSTIPVTTTPPADPRLPGVVAPELWPRLDPVLALDPEVEERIDELITAMTIEEKVGQIIQGDIADTTPDDVRTHRLGSVLAGGGSYPSSGYNAPPEEWLALADAFHEASAASGIPVLFGIDAVHGHSNVVGATLFPHNIGLGATRNPDLVREIGRITATEIRVTGMDWSFSPVVAVPQDDRWGRTYEGFSESPIVVAEMAAAMVEGLQGTVGDVGFLDGTRVMATAKHFLGDGGTTDGVDRGDTAISESILADIHAAGFYSGLAAGAQGVMVSFSSFHSVRMHANQSLLTGVLRDRMGFDGVLLGDWNGHGQVPGCSDESCSLSIIAGVDMLMAPDSWRGLYANTLAQVESGEIPLERLDEAVRRILRVKIRLGLLDALQPSERELGGRFDLLGAPGHRAVARQAVRESLVLLKNEDGILPLHPSSRLLVAGRGADDMGIQAGGWTLNWQGTGTRRGDFPNAETIWEAISSQVEAAGGTVELSVEGEYSQRPDAAIVIFGEDPYAEWFGDLPDLRYRPGDDTDRELLRRLGDEGIPLVAVFLGGRPLWLNREINAADAFVVAWLPGSEGGGVADVLVGDPTGAVRHDFVGKLGFSWPGTAAQYANNVGSEPYDPLFRFGYGLTYADDGNLALLSEDPGLE